MSLYFPEIPASLGTEESWEMGQCEDKHFNKIKNKKSQEYYELWPNKAELAALMIAKKV